MGGWVHPRDPLDVLRKRKVTGLTQFTVTIILFSPQLSNFPRYEQCGPEKHWSGKKCTS